MAASGCYFDREDKRGYVEIFIQNHSQNLKQCSIR